MGRGSVRAESAVAYFTDLVDAALSHQRLTATDLTAFYIVNLLARFLNRPVAGGEPLALKLARAVEEAGAQQRASLREIGDVSLFVSGFFSDSLWRGAVDVDYYAAIGGSAYLALSRREPDTFSAVFEELGENFLAFVDILCEVSEQTRCSTDGDLLRVYERWLRTGSPRAGQRLVDLGVLPNASLRLKARVQ